MKGARSWWFGCLSGRDALVSGAVGSGTRHNPCSSRLTEERAHSRHRAWGVVLGVRLNRMLLIAVCPSRRRGCGPSRPAASPDASLLGK